MFENCGAHSFLTRSSKRTDNPILGFLTEVTHPYFCLESLIFRISVLCLNRQSCCYMEIAGITISYFVHL